ncbi:hypothetical protein [Streptomyces sp. NRRL S-495]|uniref:hypothetical protein n=1 Tax=Streptomyces sp. NRRL S-495 TaxID=1609133 RepID=UPI0005F95A85|nr:hypothetical protein [Streptomyces sp. NRRL S-495]KJY32254.1 hypothetical protein VR45_23090 [Streptomyces sp. NRRL S-495]
MVDEKRYALYREESKVLAAIGAHVHAQVGRVTVRLPRAVAQAAVDAWERDDPDDGLRGETIEQYEVRGRAGDVALIGLVISDHGRWEDEEVVVDLDVTYAGSALLAYVEEMGTNYQPKERPEPSGG